MTLKLVFRREAEDELEQAFQWYQQRRDGLGIDFLLCVEEAIDRIQRSPESFPVVYRTARQSLVRRFPYVIYFVAGAETVTIIAVFHGSRDPTVWKRRA